MQIKVMVAGKRGDLKEAPKKEGQKFDDSSYDPKAFSGSIVLAIMKDERPSYWETIDLNVNDIAAFDGFNWGDVCELTLTKVAT